ncbi:MAG: transglycosylase domain-containing protein, partial [bacterium]|nr:transglycosylase domain-containing protein [bacterium]
MLGLFEAYGLIKNLPRPEKIRERNVVESTKIYDRTGNILLYEIHGEEKRTIVPLGEIPESVKSATLAAEDINFYNHSGIDMQGILRAIFSNLKSGRLAQGGSTITQQLIKSSLLSPEKTFSRKIREQILALLLERKYSKDEILEMYLNQVPYGSNAYGIESAARTYFAKGVKDLNINEAAALAAMTKAPSYYSPYGSNKEELYHRKNKIIDKMAEVGFIDRESAESAKNKSLIFQPIKSSIIAPHFVMFVRSLLNEKFGEDFIEKGGLKVITTLDWKLQEEAEKIIKEGAERNKKTFGASNAALVAINPKNGEILSMVGSRSYWEKSEPDGCSPGLDCLFDPHVNVSTRLRQPGSAFKPFVYATAFEKGYTPETVLFDVQTEFNPKCDPTGNQEYASDMQFGPCYHPRNYDESFRGPVSLRQSIAQSLNLPSVKLLYLAGIQDTIKTAKRMGITSLNEPEKYGLSLVLGGAEVTLLDMTSAFGVFAREGLLSPKTPIIRIENSRGEILEEKKEELIPVLDSETARTINDVLSDNEARQPMFHPRSSLYFADYQ